jgi:ATP synthase subunit 6
MKIQNPLEGFEIKILKVYSFFNMFSFSLSNYFLYFIIICVILFFFLVYNYIYSTIVPKSYQIFLEKIYNFIFECLKIQSGLISERFFVFITSVFSFILLSNILGLIFYSYTLTSQILITFGIAFSATFFIIMIGLLKKKLKFFLIFYPSGDMNIFSKIFLIIIEIISYTIRPFSLAIRLFANMLAGHTLLHILASFNFFISKKFFFFSIFIFIIVFAIGLLEVSIAFIQAYIYTILLCIYLNDSLIDNVH